MDTFTIEGKEVIEREASEAGNGAHVYVPKEWAGSDVKVIRTTDADASDVDECHVCGSTGLDRPAWEWVWTDDSGGSFFPICYNCVQGVDASPSDGCAVCRETHPEGKSDGLGPVALPFSFDACDDCREAVVFEHDGSQRAAWL